MNILVASLSLFYAKVILSKSCGDPAECAHRFDVYVNSGYLFSASLSLIGSSAIVVSFWTQPNLHKLSHVRIVVSLATVDFLFSLKFIITSASILSGNKAFETDGSLACTTAGIAGYVLGSATVGWNFMLMLNLFVLLRYPFKYVRLTSGNGWLTVASCAVWVFAVIPALAAFYSNEIGFTSAGSCWTNGTWGVFGFVVPLAFTWLWGICVLIYAAYTLRIKLKRNERGSVVFLSQMVLFVIAFISCWVNPCILLFTTVNVEREITSPWTWYLVLSSSLTVGGQGFVNFLLWRTHVLKKPLKPPQVLLTPQVA